MQLNMWESTKVPVSSQGRKNEVVNMSLVEGLKSFYGRASQTFKPKHLVYVYEKGEKGLVRFKDDERLIDNPPKAVLRNIDQWDLVDLLKENQIQNAMFYKFLNLDVLGILPEELGAHGGIVFGEESLVKLTEKEIRNLWRNVHLLDSIPLNKDHIRQIKKYGMSVPEIILKYGIKKGISGTTDYHKINPESSERFIIFGLNPMYIKVA